MTLDQNKKNPPSAPPKAEIVKINEIPILYPKQWVTVDITGRDKYGWPEEGRVVINTKKRSDITEQIPNIDGDLYVFYSGSIDDGVDDEAA